MWLVVNVTATALFAMSFVLRTKEGHDRGRSLLDGSIGLAM
jgi:hypothetical protein